MLMLGQAVLWVVLPRVKYIVLVVCADVSHVMSLQSEINVRQ